MEKRVQPHLPHLEWVAAQPALEAPVTVCNFTNLDQFWRLNSLQLQKIGLNRIRCKGHLITEMQ